MQRKNEQDIRVDEGIHNEFIVSIRDNYPLEVVKVIGENIPDVNERCYICIAIENSSNIEIIKYLIDRGSLLDESFLEDSIRVNRPDIIKLLIANGVSVDFTTSDNESFLLHALKKGMDVSVIMDILNASKFLVEREEIVKRITELGNEELTSKVNQM